jgi:putative flippase GtrA
MTSDTTSWRTVGGALPLFAVVAAIGWVVDMMILICLTSVADMSAGWSNLISSLSAAALVYLVSHHRIHMGRSNAVSSRLVAYLVYTILIVLGASLALQIIHLEIAGYMPSGQALIAAKVLITPPQFLLNFLVSRFLARKAWP